jgi:hypothetical protein
MTIGPETAREYVDRLMGAALEQEATAEAEAEPEPEASL